MSIGIIGNDNSVRGFKLAGIIHSRTVPPNNRSAALTAFQELQKKQLAMIIVTQEISSMIRKELLAALQENPIPAIVEIPGTEKPQEKTRLVESITNKAIGAGIR